MDFRRNLADSFTATQIEQVRTPRNSQQLEVSEWSIQPFFSAVTGLDCRR